MQLTMWPSRCWAAAPLSVNVQRAQNHLTPSLTEGKSVFVFCIVSLFFGVALIIFMHRFAVWFVPSVKAKCITVSL